MKRLNIKKITEVIETLKNAEATRSNYAEVQRKHAIACLENYRTELESLGITSVKIKQEGQDERASHMDNPMDGPGSAEA